MFSVEISFKTVRVKIHLSLLCIHLLNFYQTEKFFTTIIIISIYYNDNNNNNNKMSLNFNKTQ